MPEDSTLRNGAAKRIPEMHQSDWTMRKPQVLCQMLCVRQILDLEANKVADLDGVALLGMCPKLQALTLEGNDVAAAPDYRSSVVELIPTVSNGYKVDAAFAARIGGDGQKNFCICPPCHNFEGAMPDPKDLLSDTIMRS